MYAYDSLYPHPVELFPEFNSVFVSSNMIVVEFIIPVVIELKTRSKVITSVRPFMFVVSPKRI